MINADSYEVGRGKPPKSTQFQKGRSGNPKGRPKGSQNVATTLRRILRERVVVNENGRRKTITKVEAALKQLTNKAATGDLPSIRLLMALCATAEQGATDTEVKDRPLGEADREVMASILKRFNPEAKAE